MNEGATNFYSDIKMDFSTQDTILGVVREITNMQRNKDGEHTARASIAISVSQVVLAGFMAKYDECIDKSICIEGIDKGEWKDLKELITEKK
ncbi:MAG: hypothetical protein HDR29_04220 [Lachnospiraceae bacterium]|nr:hypothetical protein [Lachnospiraceae bacterium]